MRPPALRTPTRALVRAPVPAIIDAGDPTIMRVVAIMDAMISAGPLPADRSIAPKPQRVAVSRPPHRLRFTRLMFHPLDPLIVPAARWQPGLPAIPRSALLPMARHVRLAMAADAGAIDAEIAACTTADTASIARLGRLLWPAAARVLADPAIAQTWDATTLGEPAYRPLADSVAALLAEAPALDTLCSDTATGLLPATAETVAPLLGRVAKTNPAALPMMITLLLDRLPEAAGLLPQAHEGQAAAAIQAALNTAADHLLGPPDQPAGGAGARVATGTLAEAGAAASRIATLLTHLEITSAKPHQRDRLRAVRRQLHASCKARFVSALQDELLAPLQHNLTPLMPADITTLETTARGLRILETGARAAGGGPTYDLLLGKAAAAIRANAMRDRLARANQVRLVEILTGPDAALAMLDQPP